MKPKKTTILRTIVVTAALLLLLLGLCACDTQKEYAVSTPSVTKGGKVTLSTQYAKQDEEVTVTLTPDTGYELAALRVNDKDVTAQVENGIYRFVPTATSKVIADFRAVSYQITYMDGDTPITGLSPATYTIEQTVELPTPDIAGREFVAWYANDTLSGIACTRISAGSTGNKVFYAKWEPAKLHIEGTLKSATYEVGGQQYDLYALDYSKASVVLTDGVTQYAAVIAADGTYSVSVPAGTYTLRYTYPNFICNDTTVTVDNNGLTAETAANVNLTVKIPLVADTTTVGGSTVTAGKTDIFDYTDAANHTITIPKGYDDDAYLVGTEGTVVLFEAVIRNAQSNGTGTATRYQTGLIISAFMNGTSKTRDAILFDQTNAAGAYSGNLVRPWLANAWNNTNLVGDIANVANMKEDVGVKLTLVRVDTVMYVFVDDQFVSLVTGLKADAGALGFQTLSKTGGTYSNYIYSYNEELIRAKIAAAVELPASVENATLTADKTADVKLGDTLTFTLTPAEGYTVDTFVINGTDYAADMILTDGVFTLTYKVTDVTVTVETTVKQNA